MRMTGDSHVMQVWHLSDLTLVRTLTIPKDWGEAAEPRILSDSRTVLVSTFGCALPGRECTCRARRPATGSAARSWSRGSRGGSPAALDLNRA